MPQSCARVKMRSSARRTTTDASGTAKRSATTLIGRTVRRDNHRHTEDLSV